MPSPLAHDWFTQLNCIASCGKRNNNQQGSAAELSLWAQLLYKYNHCKKPGRAQTEHKLRSRNLTNGEGGAELGWTVN